MLHKRTNNLQERAADIADREAEPIWQATGNYAAWWQVWKETYEAALRELSWQP
jgi:hypothetical protein